MSGTATLSPANTQRLDYFEEGLLQYGRGPAMSAQRRYRWKFEGSEVVVTFEDGRDFHRFVPMGQVDGTDHPCGDDYYTVAYDFSRWPTWHATWRVLGPRKDYTSYTQYIRR